MKRVWKWLLLLGLFAASAAAGMYAAAQSPEISGQAAPAQAADTEYIALTCRLILRSEYQLCGHVSEEEMDMPAAYVGLDKQQLRQVLENTSISKFSAKEVVLTKRPYCYCPEHLVVYWEEGMLQVYRTKAGGDQAELVQQLALDRGALSSAEVRALRQGKVFSTMAEVRAYAAAQEERE